MACPVRNMINSLPLPLIIILLIINFCLILLLQNDSPIGIHCLHGIVPSYLLLEFRHARLFHGYNTKSCDLLCPPRLPRIIRQVEMLSNLKSSYSAILNCNACSMCYLCNLINFLVLMFFCFCVVSGRHLTL